jgi:GDP-L-fucose synthase
VNILITGGTGFLGKHVEAAFDKHIQDKELNDTITCVGSKFDLVSGVECDHLFNITCPDVVVHMAAVCGGILANKNRPVDFLRDNTLMGINIFESARRFNVKRVYTLGSVCSYPLNCPTPFKEDDIFNGYPESTNAPYGQAKRTLMMLGNTYREQYGIAGAHLIPVNLFGPHDHFDLVNSHVIPALINKFVNAVDKGLSTVRCWGTGLATREFFYAEDAAKAIVSAVYQSLDTELPINLGTGKEISIKELAHLIAKLVGFDGEVLFTGEVSDGQPKRRLDVSRAKEMLNFEADTNLLTGLVKTITWYQDNL